MMFRDCSTEIFSYTSLEKALPGNIIPLFLLKTNFLQLSPNKVFPD